MFDHNQDPLSHKTCWILSDGRPGHRNQSLGLAHALGLKDVEVKELAFRRFGKFFGLLSPRWRFKTLPSTPYPDIIIGCGSHIAPLSAYIKRRSPTTFTVHLMNQPRAANLFDVVALPAHSNGKATADNIVTTQGALNHIQPDILTAEAKRWASRLKHVPQQRTAILLGGNSKHFQFTPELITQCVNDITAFAQANKMALLIATSRRTPAALVQTLETALKQANISFYLWDSSNPQTPDNPYLAFLGSAQAIMITADSVSMISEAATSGKTTLVWGRDLMQKAKFKRFYAQLLQQKSIADLANYTPDLKTIPLQEAKRVAGFVRSKFLRK